MVANHDHHREVLDLIDEVPKYRHYSILNHYLRTSQIKDKVKLREFNKDERMRLDVFYEILKAIVQDPLPKHCRFLFEANLDDLATICAYDVVYFYGNSTMKTDQLTYLIAHELQQVNQEQSDWVAKSEINEYIGRIKKLVEFEQINLKNKSFNDRTMNTYIDKFFKDNNHNIMTISENVYHKYLE